jgi:hypothetical protein
MNLDRSALRPGTLVVPDDYQRPDEQQIIARWRRLHPQSRLHEPAHEKGTAVLTTPITRSP